MVYLSIQYYFCFPKICPPQVLLGAFLNILFHVMVYNNIDTENVCFRILINLLRGQFKSTQNFRLLKLNGQQN